MTAIPSSLASKDCHICLETLGTEMILDREGNPLKRGNEVLSEEGSEAGSIPICENHRIHVSCMVANLNSILKAPCFKALIAQQLLGDGAGIHIRYSYDARDAIKPALRHLACTICDTSSEVGVSKIKEICIPLFSLPAQQILNQLLEEHLLKVQECRLKKEKKCFADTVQKFTNALTDASGYQLAFTGISTVIIPYIKDFTVLRTHALAISLLITSSICTYLLIKDSSLRKKIYQNPSHLLMSGLCTLALVYFAKIPASFPLPLTYLAATALQIMPTWACAVALIPFKA